MKVRFTGAALHQLREIKNYINTRNPSASDRIIKQKRIASQLIGQFPELGRSVPVRGVREWIVSGLPYVLVYKADALKSEIIILAIFHTAQSRQIRLDDD